MVATLYHIPRTISSPIVQVLLELDLVNNPIHVEEINFRALKSKAHLAINPMGTSPAFQDTETGITIWESGAVLSYILERYDIEYQFHPKPITSTSTQNDIQIRAKYLHLKQYIIATVYPFVAAMYLHSLKPIDQQDMNYMDASKHKCESLICPILKKWYNSGPYFLGSEISAVDFLIVKPFRNLHAMGLLNNDNFPELYDLYDRITKRESYDNAYNDGLDMSIITEHSIIMVPTKSKKQQLEQRPTTSTTTSITPGTATIKTNGKYDEKLLDVYKAQIQESAIDGTGSTTQKKRGFAWSSLRK